MSELDSWCFGFDDSSVLLLWLEFRVGFEFGIGGGLELGLLGLKLKLELGLLGLIRYKSYLCFKQVKRVYKIFQAFIHFLIQSGAVL